MYTFPTLIYFFPKSTSFPPPQKITQSETVPLTDEPLTKTNTLRWFLLLFYHFRVGLSNLGMPASVVQS